MTPSVRFTSRGSASSCCIFRLAPLGHGYVLLHTYLHFLASDLWRQKCSHAHKFACDPQRNASAVILEEGSVANAPTPVKMRSIKLQSVVFPSPFPETMPKCQSSQLQKSTRKSRTNKNHPIMAVPVIIEIVRA